MNDSQLDYAIKYGKRKSDINNTEINILELPYYFVKWEFADTASIDIRKATIDALNLLKLDYKSLTNNELNSIFLYLYDALLTKEGLIYQLEQRYLSSIPDPNMIAAGQNELAPWSNLMTLFDLANEDITKMKEVSEMKYQEVLDVQAMLTKRRKIQDNYQRIISKK